MTATDDPQGRRRMQRFTVTRSELAGLDHLCHGIVTRDYEGDACSKPATAIIYDLESANIWPACTWHAHRYGGAVPLSTIHDALTVGAGHLEREVFIYDGNPWNQEGDR